MRSNEIRTPKGVRGIPRTPFGVRFPVTSLTGGRRAKSMRVYHRLLSRHAFGVQKRPNSRAPASASALARVTKFPLAVLRKGEDVVMKWHADLRIRMP